MPNCSYCDHDVAYSAHRCSKCGNKLYPETYDSDGNDDFMFLPSVLALAGYALFYWWGLNLWGEHGYSFFFGGIGLVLGGWIGVRLITSFINHMEAINMTLGFFILGAGGLVWYFW